MEDVYKKLIMALTDHALNGKGERWEQIRKAILEAEYDVLNYEERNNNSRRPYEHSCEICGTPAIGSLCDGCIITLERLRNEGLT